MKRPRPERDAGGGRVAGAAPSMKMMRWLYAVLAAFALAEIVVPSLVGSHDAHFWFEDLPAWGSLYGLVSCLLIIVVSKLLGKLWLTRSENYYEP
jgi:hypothetical protein